MQCLNPKSNNIRPSPYHHARECKTIVDVGIINLNLPRKNHTNEMIRVHYEFYDVVGCIVHDPLTHELNTKFAKDEVVDMVLMLLNTYM